MVVRQRRHRERRRGYRCKCRIWRRHEANRYLRLGSRAIGYKTNWNRWGWRTARRHETDWNGRVRVSFRSRLEPPRHRRTRPNVRLWPVRVGATPAPRRCWQHRFGNDWEDNGLRSIRIVVLWRVGPTVAHRRRLGSRCAHEALPRRWAVKTRAHASRVGPVAVGPR